MDGSELGSITVEELEEFVSSDGEPLSNQDLTELQSNPVANEEEPEEDPVLTSSGIQEALSKIYSGLNMLESMDRDVDRISSVRQALRNSVACYEEILMDRKQKPTQKTLDCYFTKK
ncbi:hypothetical protein O0L34_g7629 [Tuta absoluta]|nr:hypothetical protein O0L34_g7629 [Tuta absoluta]